VALGTSVRCLTSHVRLASRNSSAVVRAQSTTTCHETAYCLSSWSSSRQPDVHWRYAASRRVAGRRRSKRAQLTNASHTYEAHSPDAVF